jgi:hypothetical protein
VAGKGLLLRPGSPLLRALNEATDSRFAFALPLTLKVRRRISWQTADHPQSASTPDHSITSSGWTETAYRGGATQPDPYRPNLYVAFRDCVWLQPWGGEGASDREPRQSKDILVVHWHPGRQVEILDGFTLEDDRTSCALVDANQDGRLDLFVGSSPAAGPSGELHTFTIEPAGRLRPMPLRDEGFRQARSELDPEAISASGGNFVLRDLDHDGKLEVETIHPVYQGTDAYDYGCAEIFAFDNDTREWVRATSRFVGEVGEQRQFYEAYLAAARTFEAHQAQRTVTANSDTSWQPCRRLLHWHGKDYMVGEFPAEAIAGLLQSWAP